LRIVAEENLKFPRDHASDLLRDTAFGDWRDVIKRIKLPTLVVGGDGSMFSSASQQWIASQIPESQLEIFSETEGGSHFMFLENPNSFNAKVLSYLATEV
jgi:pimeloyl-ACP methyl ester carboxylesterase